MRFRLVDKILSLQSGRLIETVKAVSFEEYQLCHPLGIDEQWVPTLLVEAMLQSGNWLIIASSDFTQLGLVVQIKKINIKRPPGRGERVRFEVGISSLRSEAALLEGRGWIGDEEVIEGIGCIATLAPLAQFEDPDDLRVIFSEIAPGVKVEPHPELVLPNGK